MLRVRDSLRADGLEVWTDENLTPGTRSWKAAIENALENAACLVVIFSPDAKKSAWVREEMNYAEAQDIRIFPLLARGDEKTAVPFGFITAQWVDIRQEADFTSGLQKLAFTVRVHLGMVSQEPRAPQPASITLHAEEELPREDKTQPRRQGTPFPPNVTKAIMVLQNRDSKWWRRVDAVTRLGELRDPVALPALRAYLDDPDPDVQRAAQKAIELISAASATLKTDTEETQPVVRPFIEGTFEEEIAAGQPAYVGAGGAAGISPAGEGETTPGVPAAKKTAKIVVTGTSAALRRQFISSISEIEVVSTERSVSLPDGSASVAMDYGQITVGDDLVMYLFGSPGERELAFIWEVLAEGMLGFIMLMDGSQPYTFRHTRAILDNFRAYAPVPFVIAVASDRDDAWSPEDIRIALRLEEGVKILPYAAGDHQAVKTVLVELFELLLNCSSLF